MVGLRIFLKNISFSDLLICKEAGKKSEGKSKKKEEEEKG